MRSKIIFILIIFSLIIGCVDTSKFSSIQKSVPCTIQTSSNGGFTGTITQGDCKGKLPEDKIVGTWKLKTQYVETSITFNSDRTGKITSSETGNSYFKWNIANNRIYFNDVQGLNVITLFGGSDIPYNLINNDKTLIISGVSFEKSWW